MTEQRLIDAEETIEFVKKYTLCINGETTMECVERSIRNAPTIEAKPVVHGRWETNSDRPDLLICSVCKCGFDMWKHDPHNYCPNCGAQMDSSEVKDE